MNRELFDVHCHIIPDVDDGSDSIETSLRILRGEYGAGVRHIILTPHYRKGMFEADRDYVGQQFEELKRRIEEETVSSLENSLEGLQLYLGCEYHSNMDMVEEIHADPRFRLNGTGNVLLEFSSFDEWNYIRERVYALRSSGLTPVIAHIERYPVFLRSPELVRDLKNTGALIQVNADSILGKDGRKAKKFARKLIEEDLLDFVGSDAHDMKHRPSRIGACFDWIAKKYGKAYARWLFCEHPAELIKPEIP